MNIQDTMVFLLLVLLLDQAMADSFVPQAPDCVPTKGGEPKLVLTVSATNQTEPIVQRGMFTQHLSISHGRQSKGVASHLVVKWLFPKQIEFDSAQVINGPKHTSLMHQESSLIVKFDKLDSCQNISFAVKFKVDHQKTTSPGKSTKTSIFVSLEHNWEDEYPNGATKVERTNSSCVYYAPICSQFRPLGMRDGRIKESQLSCASYMKPQMNKTGNCAHFARPGSVGVFMVEEGLLHYDRRNFLQVDFRSRTRVEMVSIEGSGDIYVKTFQIQSSDDNVMWMTYKEKETENPKEFPANDESTPVKISIISPPIISQYLRINPRSWRNNLSMAFEFYGCLLVAKRNMPRPLGMESGVIKDSQISVSSETENGTRDQSRLNSGQDKAWCVQESDTVRTLTIDLKKEYSITQISIQGKMCYPDNLCDTPPEFVYLAFDGKRFKQNGKEKRFQGNQVDHVITHTLIVPQKASKVTFDLSGTQGKRCMRVELYGKPAEEEESVPIVQRGFLCANDGNRPIVFFCFGEYFEEDEMHPRSTCILKLNEGKSAEALDPTLFTILAFDPETKRLYGVSKHRHLYMESRDVYGHEWHVIMPVKWEKVRAKPGIRFTQEVPFIPETRFTRLPAPYVTDTDISGNKWGGSSIGLHVFPTSVNKWLLTALWRTHDISECHTNPCLHGGTCNVETNGYTCSCLPFVLGRNCEKGLGLAASAILQKNVDYLTVLTNWLKPVVRSNSYWKHCWRASVDGWADTTFHSLCDNKGPTVTIIRVGQYIFGGYTGSSWTSNCQWGSSPTAFLFSLVNKPGWGPVKLSQPGERETSSTHAAYGCTSYGPTFGGGPGIYIASDASSNTDSFSNPGYTYSSPTGHSFESYFAKSFLAGSHKFQPDEVEVYYENT